MMDNMRKFIAQPSVFQVNKPSRITVIPLRFKYTFTEGKEYDVYVMPMAYSRALALNTPDLTVKSINGKLIFDYTFKHECEYEIRFCEKGAANFEYTSIYAVESDLYELRPLKGDLHIHTNRSDSEDDPAEVVSNYRREGYDFTVITDHNRYFPSQETIESFADVDIDLNIINGEEVHTPVTNLHIVHVGGKKSVDEFYVKNRVEYELEVDEIRKELPDNEYADRMAKALWATRRIHEAEGIAILPHPFWIQPAYGSVYNLALPFLEMLFNEGGFDAYELIGAMRTSGNNLSVAYLNELKQKGFKIPVVASSDSHKTLDDPKMRFGKLYTIVFAKDNTREGVLEGIKNGLSAAVEHVPETTDNKTEYRVYADFRLTMYTRFLIENYFERTKELCLPEGILMREYILGAEGAKEALESLHGKTTKFYNSFFGKVDESYYNTDNAQKTYKKYNGIWKDYAVTKRGSTLDADAVK